MKRAEKESFVEEFSKKIGESDAFALFSFNKLSVEQVTELRLGLRKKGVRLKVVKNTLAKRVLGGTDYASLVDQLKGPTIVALGEQDAVTTAKALWEWVGKDDFDFQPKGGAALGGVMDAKQLEALSKLPGREELLTGFLWALKSAPTKFAFALTDAQRRLGYALAALKDKKGSES